MNRTQIYIPDDLRNELDLLVAAGEGKLSDLVREGISLVVKKKRKKGKKKFDPWKDFVGKGPRGGPSDVSSNHDYYLYVEPYENKKRK